MEGPVTDLNLNLNVQQYVRELWQQCRAAMDTWVLIDPQQLADKVLELNVSGGWNAGPDDHDALLRVGLLAAWELHPLKPRFDRALAELNATTPFLQEVKALAAILPHRQVEVHWELVRKAAGRFHIPGSLESEAEFQDLLSVGREALFIAAQKYYRKPRGPFKNFAWTILREKMRDEQGKRHPVPARIRKKLAVLGQLREEHRLRDKVLDPPAIKELMRLQPEELHELLQIEAVWGNGLEFETDVVLEELEEPDHSLDQLGQLLEIEDAMRLEVALQLLGEPEKSVIQKLYFEEKSLRETAEEMDMNLQAFKKIHKKALAEMKKFLATESTR